MAEKLLEVKNLRTSFFTAEGEVKAVDNVSYHVNKGEVIAIVGESGCGKSITQMSVMQLVQSPPGKIMGGEVLFEGKNLLDYDAKSKQMRAIRGAEIAMIFQEPMTSLNPVYRTGSQVEEAILLDGLSHKEAWERVINLYKDVRIPDAEKRVNSYPHELSGGMRQRVMIAMMLSRTPELLIADEPTTALDVTIEAQILQILKDLKTQYNTAILMITHNFGLVAEVADRIAVMYAGNIVEQGNVFDVFAAPSHPYTRLLMRALPRKTKHEGRLETIDGNVPRITEKKPGCRFANRCPLAKEICFTENPPVLTVSHDHTFSCHFAEEASKL